MVVAIFDHWSGHEGARFVRGGARHLLRPRGLLSCWRRCSQAHSPLQLAAACSAAQASLQEGGRRASCCGSPAGLDATLSDARGLLVRAAKMKLQDLTLPTSTQHSG